MVHHHYAQTNCAFHRKYYICLFNKNWKLDKSETKAIAAQVYDLSSQGRSQRCHSVYQFTVAGDHQFVAPTRLPLRPFSFWSFSLPSPTSGVTSSGLEAWFLPRFTPDLIFGFGQFEGNPACLSDFQDMNFGLEFLVTHSEFGIICQQCLELFIVAKAIGQVLSLS